MSDLRRVGRPRATHCKRGHERKPDEKSCIACRRFRERLKYRFNEEFREKKKGYQRKWRRDFFEKNGFWAAELYR
jgi:hypothetical protein